MSEDLDILASDYVLGILPANQQKQLQRRASTDTEFAEAVAIWRDRLAPLMDDAAEIAPPNGLLEKIEKRLDRGLSTGARASVTVREDEGKWVTIAPGVRQKYLYKDEQTGASAFFIDMDAGAVIPPHDHAANEDCLVLSGDYYMGDLTLGAGDFHAAFRGTTHAACGSRTGCRLFVKSAI